MIFRPCFHASEDGPGSLESALRSFIEAKQQPAPIDIRLIRFGVCCSEQGSFNLETYENLP